MNESTNIDVKKLLIDLRSKLRHYSLYQVYLNDIHIRPNSDSVDVYIKEHRFVRISTYERNDDRLNVYAYSIISATTLLRTAR